MDSRLNLASLKLWRSGSFGEAGGNDKKESFVIQSIVALDWTGFERNGKVSAISSLSIRV